MKGHGKGKGQTHTNGKGRGWTKPQDGATSHTQTDSKHDKGKANNTTAKPFQGECRYCGIYGHQSRDCRKRIYAESKTKKQQTNNSVKATQVTFDADEDDLPESDPNDETTTLFQSVLNADKDSEGTDSDNDITAPTPQAQDTTSQDTDTDSDIAEEDKEYYTELID